MMWMMGRYNDAGDFNSNNIQDPPFTGGRKLRPLMPRPTTAVSTSLPCLTRIHTTNHFLGLNHHLAMMEQNKREVIRQQVVVSSRWNPTPEQLQTLEELYRRGTRTPTAEQIQQITAQLRRYGKIEGKNVFYWFQNHKARERQKRRRQLESLSADENNNNNQTEKGENKREPPGLNRTAFEVEQTKNWASPTNSSTIAQKTTQGATKGAEAECKSDGWVQFDVDAAEITLQQRRNATWQMMHLSSSSSSSSSSSPFPTTHVTTTIPSTLTTILQKQPHHHDFINIFNLKPYNIPQDLDDHHEEAHTLKLFPLESGRGLNDECDHEEDEQGGGGRELGLDMNNHHVTTPYHFF